MGRKIAGAWMLAALVAVLAGGGPKPEALAAGGREENPQEIKIYNVTDLLTKPSDFLAPSTGFASTVPGALLGEEEKNEFVLMTMEDLDRFVKVFIPEIQQFGGEVVVLENLQSLYVKATPGLHKRVENLLSEFRKQFNRLVELEGRFVSIDAGAWRKVLGKEGARKLAHLSDDQLARLEEAIAGGAATVIDEGRLICHDTQRVYWTSLRERSYIKDVAMLVGQFGGCGLDPEVGTVREGAFLEVRPVISGNGETLVMEVKGTMASVQPQMRIQEVGSPEKEADCTVRVGQLHQRGVIELPVLDLNQCRSTVRVANGKTVAFGCTARGDAAGSGKLVILALRATVVSTE